MQIICGQNCTFVVQSSGTVLACGEGSYGRLGQGNSDDNHNLTAISSIQGRSFNDCLLNNCIYTDIFILVFIQLPKSSSLNV